ncbi:protein bicaudal C homolog 1 [Parasteatoda tepidariorum]|uniref:protein bicaudal C homolog 1 n=1 Tax=Parasteatoda tepidariorum TaxID=114398 RepID=UPI00077FD9AD|nr:protein bicaudal C homolog 1 [Parasteatoda tepidariorum]
MFSPTFQTRVSHSLSSNPESPASTSNEDPKDSASDSDFSTKSYLSELFESDLKEERFRIDRKKLEDMLQAQQSTSETNENAEEFFQRVMFETSTQISWPSKLKIGAKSKKDPHVKIVGKPEDVLKAKEKILEILDTKKNRVTLKMDVSHSDHSYIIGKGGFKIQQVMEETGCHIHFPDSNRNSTVEKSNQVSIAGQAAGVEMARSKIRDLLPLVFTFELPNGESVKPGEESSPAVSHIQQTYSFNVSFWQVGPVGMGRTVLEVRGCQRLLSRLRQGLALLMEYLIGSKTIPIIGFMKTEIAAQHHQYVMGPCESNIQMITNKTGAKIIFPGAGTENPLQLTPLKSGHMSKSTVLILGSFDSVCLAWQELLKCLPLVLMFDLKEGQELDPVMVNNFMESFNINIMVRPKMKENTKSVLIRGCEKDGKILFQVRKEILNLDEEDFYPLSPNLKQSSYRMTSSETFGRVRFNKRELRDEEKPRHEREVFNSIKQTGSTMSTAESLTILSNIIQQNPQIVGLINNLSSVFPPNMPVPDDQVPILNPGFRPNIHNYVHNLQPKQYPMKSVESWINRPDRSYAFTPGVNTENYLQKDKQTTLDDQDSGIYMATRNKLFGGLEPKSDTSSRPESSASSTSSDTPDFEHSRFARKELLSERSAASEVGNFLADYENKKLLASKVIQESAEGVRTPSHIWAGYGFSKSMPDFAGRRKSSTAQLGSVSEYLEVDSKVSNVEAAAAKAWNADVSDTEPQVSSPFALSNFWENVPRQPPNYGSVKNLEQLLCLLDLDKYNDVFTNQEIDLPTFLALTEIDLQQLNISYIARRKMLAAISAIRENKMGEWPSRQFRAAPGAERKTFRYSGSTNEDCERI